MYESEIGNIRKKSDLLTSEIANCFKNNNKNICHRTVLSWSEHCVECVWPSCYSSCSLYSAREDGRCRLFTNGMVRIDNPGAINNYFIEIEFKRWGKLWCPGNTRLLNKRLAQYIENTNDFIGKAVSSKKIPRSVRSFTAKKIYSLKKKLSQQNKNNDSLPDSFLFECYNPDSQVIGITISFRSDDQSSEIQVFQKRIELRKGYNCEDISVNDITKFVDLKKRFSIDITHDQSKDKVKLYFGFIDFVKYSEKRENKKIKCVVWDLDNTIWDGVLIEDGPEKVRLKDGIKDVLLELDRRGILNSIASKNNYDDAINCLKKNEIYDLFLFPQISWGAKSESIKQISKKLNLGMDTFLFVDDQIFEREEVRNNCPGTRVLDSIDFNKIINMPECDVTITNESSIRRKLYKQEEVRQQDREQFGDKYYEFLRSCNLSLTISALSLSNIGRVHELIQRTNQMNFSGNRYSKYEIEEFINNEKIDTYVIECEDKYGKYGIIGFGAVEIENKTLIDLMFSCRIQSKRVEHAFITYLLNKYLPESSDGFWVKYRETEKNKPSAKVFTEFQFIAKKENNGITLFNFPPKQTVPNENIISINEEY